MIPFFRGPGLPGNTVDSQVSVTVPAGVQAGDTVIAVIAVGSGSAAVTTPAGWTQVRVVTSGSYRNTIMRRTASSSEGSVYTFHLSASVPVSALTVAYAGVDTSAPVDVDGSATATSTTATAPSVTTTGAQRLVVVVTGAVADTVVAASSGTTSRTTTGGGPSIRLADFVQATAGATGAKTSTIGTSSANIGYQLALKPANLAPDAPILAAPVGGASFDRTAAKTFTWSISDPDVGDAQSKFDLQYRLVGTSTWATRSVSTSASATTFAGYTFLAGNYEWQVRTYDSHGEVGPWSPSALFTAVTPPPNAPSLTRPVPGTVLDRTATQRFKWVFSDVAVGESQAQYDLQYRVTGGGAWTTVTAPTPNQFRDFGPGTFPAASYEWQVRTYDSQGQVGPWSTSGFFTAADPPAGPVITSPVNGQAVTSSPTSVTWSTPDQASYQLRRVADAGGVANTGTVYFDTGELVGTATRALAVSFPIDNQTEHVQLRVKDSHGFWSPWTDVEIATSYDLPPAPAVLLRQSGATASITVMIVNPAAGFGEVETTSNDIYRRGGLRDGGGVRVAVGVAPNTDWTDLTPASGVAYSYQVVAIGTNGLGHAAGWIESALSDDPDNYPALSRYPSLTTFPGG